MDRYAKAIIGAIVAGLGALAQALTDGQITATEWAIVVGALLSGLALVWGYPNAPIQPVYPPVPDTITTVNVDRAPMIPAARPGSGGRVMEDPT